MSSQILLTLTGPDRLGVVEDVTRTLLGLGGNVGTSRMIRLGGQFAMLMQLDVAREDVTAIEAAFQPLVRDGYRVSVVPDAGAIAERADWKPYLVSVSGADHEGIVHEIAAELANAGITIEEAETGTVAASVSGTPLFTMQARILVPPTIDQSAWMTALDEAAARSGVDAEVIAEG